MNARSMPESAPVRALRLRTHIALLVAALAAACGGGGGGGGSAPVAEVAPLIAVQPASVTTADGGGVVFRISATGTGLVYQWQFSIDGGKTWVNIAGASDLSYTIALVQAFMNGWQYRVAVTGSGGAVTTSAPATLSLARGSGAPLAAFGAAPDGKLPNGTPLIASDGNLYGTTLQGGANGGGTLYRITPAGVKTILHSFASGAGSDGSGPLAGLIQAPDGNLYGTTSNGGTYNNGTVYRVTTAGVVTVLYSFSNGADGGVPYLGVTLASDGNLYGTTHFGGANDRGTLYRLTPAGTFTVLHAFGGPGDGSQPTWPPIQAADGNLYGTSDGGANGNGMVYRMSLSGSYTVLYSFGTGTDGKSPGPLLQASDGNFYGNTYYGGVNGAGTIYRLTPAGAETVLHSFGAPGDGQNPYAGLIQGLDGAFYGTTNGGGSNSKGTVYRITAAGDESVIYTFSGANDGQNPTAGVVQAANGTLYGACQFGGANNAGTVYEITP